MTVKRACHQSCETFVHKRLQFNFNIPDIFTQVDSHWFSGFQLSSDEKKIESDSRIALHCVVAIEIERY